LLLNGKKKRLAKFVNDNGKITICSIFVTDRFLPHPEPEATLEEGSVAEPGAVPSPDGTSPDGTSPVPGVSSYLQQQDMEEEEEAEKQPEVTKEEKRRMLTAKRTSEDSLSSAKQRYLARKRAQISAPVVSTDDD